LTGDDQLAPRLAADFEAACIDESDKVMLRYADKLTRDPAAMNGEDVTKLRVAGFADAAILDICQVTAYFAFANRLADGLGVEMEGE
jgi:uncharacterized peroxidase-related enzyme